MGSPPSARATVQDSQHAGRTQSTMSATKAQPLAIFAVIALFLYWVVQDPVGAAEMIRTVFEAALSFLQLVAERVVQFLSALT